MSNFKSAGQVVKMHHHRADLAHISWEADVQNFKVHVFSSVQLIHNKPEEKEWLFSSMMSNETNYNCITDA